tara:strand:- start:463 stop:1674 length:1212 start_codon:yes stop_codon:yes gene_type:complete
MFIKKILTLLIIFLCTVYSLEILLYQFLPNEQKRLTNIKEKRIEIAKKYNLQYDDRSNIEVYFEESKKNKKLSTPFYFNKTYYNLVTVKDNLGMNKLIPFRGPINAQTISCAEDLKYKIINNDKYGFKNPNLAYEKEIDIILLGDSYAEGLCENEKNDTAGHLRKMKFNTLNFGVTGSGPLLSLAVLKEYGLALKPKNIVYFYFEGNDLLDLEWEKNTYLINYLRPNFQLDYLKYSEEIKEFLNNAHEEKILLMKTFISEQKESKKDDKKLIALTKDILELTTLKKIWRSKNLFSQKDLEMDLFFDILKKMRFETTNNGGNFIFVYIPSWSRYFTKYNENKILFNKKNEILNFLKKEKIPFFDFENEILDSSDKKKYFPLGYIGHFNAFGYKEISNSIINLIN